MCAIKHLSFPSLLCFPYLLLYLPVKQVFFKPAFLSACQVGLCLPRLFVSFLSAYCFLIFLSACFLSAWIRKPAFLVSYPSLFSYLKLSTQVWLAGPLHNLKCCGILGQIFGLILSFLSNRWLQVILDGKSLQEYPVNAGVPQGSILDRTLPAIH